MNTLDSARHTLEAELADLMKQRLTLNELAVIAHELGLKTVVNTTNNTTLSASLDLVNNCSIRNLIKNLIESLRQHRNDLGPDLVKISDKLESLNSSPPIISDSDYAFDMRGDDFSNSKCQFVNRVDDIKFIKSQPDNSLYVISSPAQYGKTMVLDEVIKEVNNNSEEKQWIAVKIDFRQKETNYINVNSILLGILQIYCAKASQNEVEKTKYTDWLNKSFSRSSNIDQNFLELGSLITNVYKKSIFVIFDHCNEVDTKLYNQILDKIPSLFIQSFSQTNYVSCKFIFCGRNLSRPFLPIKSKEFYEIKLFKASHVSQLLQNMIQWKANVSIDDYAYNIYRISGGHPKIICEIAKFINKNPLFNWESDAMKESLYKKCVEGVFCAIKKDFFDTEFPEHLNKQSLWDSLLKLSILRKFGFNHLEDYDNKLRKQGEIFLNDLSANEFIKNLSKTCLIHRKDYFYSDGTVRDVLLIYYRYKNTEKCKIYNRLAYECFIEVAKSKKGSELMENLIEALYHFLEGKGESEISLSFIREEIEYYYKEFTDLKYMDKADVRTYFGTFNDKLKDDSYIGFYLSNKSFIKNIETFLNEKLDYYAES